MATVVYKPQQEGIGYGLGKGMSQGLMKEFEKRERQERIQKVQAAFEGIRSASERGGRAAALEAANVAMGLAEDPADVKTILGYVEQVAPPENFQQVPIVDQDNNPSLAFIPSQKLGQLNTPEGKQSLLPQGTKIGRPEDEFEFIKPPAEEGGTPQFLGKGPMSKKPAGTITTKEFEFGRQLEADRRADTSLTRQEERDRQLADQHAEEMRMRERSETRADARHRQSLAVQSRAAGNQQADNFRADANRGTQSLLALSGKRMEDGSISFFGENEKKLFASRQPFFEQRLEEEYKKSKGGPINVGKIVDEAIKKFPGSESKEPGSGLPPPSPKKEEGPGLLDRAGQAIKAAKDALMGRGDLPPVKTQADYDKLPPGTEFQDASGKRYKKPGKK